MSKKVKSCPAWMTTFADLMSLLMAMFVLLYAMSNTDEVKYAQAVESLTGAFAGEGRLSSEQVTYLNSIKSRSDSTKESAEPPQSSADIEVKETLVNDLSPLYESLLETFSKNSDMKDIKIEFDAVLNQIKMVFAEQIAFDRGNAELKPRFAKLLKDSYALQAEPVLIKVIGHTDKLPIVGGRFHSNWELSSARAASVVVQLIAVGSVRADQVQAIGVADTQPQVIGDTEIEFAKNRRVEVLISSEKFKY
ncbi:MAG: flagellar motor protein MotB [Thiomicrorhabdus sp.]|jgi:chemotaxis protein MotB|nr:flagellar motor protein MotB [Thiomicrorhabdus sp.]